MCYKFWQIWAQGEDLRVGKCCVLGKNRGLQKKNVAKVSSLQRCQIFKAELQNAKSLSTMTHILQANIQRSTTDDDLMVE